MQDKYVAPNFDSDAFNCPHCGAYAHQKWFRGLKSEIKDGVPPSQSHWSFVKNLYLSICSKCKNYSLWIGDKIVHPISSIAPFPVENMPEDVKGDFLEARNIVNASPRAAAALLRLALQKLMPHLGEKGKDLNGDIGNLVKKGLPERIQKALDSVRVIGNEAVHPGQMDLRDDREIAITLFKLLNLIIDVMITRPKEIDQIYDRLPISKREGIVNRDKIK